MFSGLAKEVLVARLNCSYPQIVQHLCFLPPRFARPRFVCLLSGTGFVGQNRGGVVWRMVEATSAVSNQALQEDMVSAVTRAASEAGAPGGEKSVVAWLLDVHSAPPVGPRGKARGTWRIGSIIRSRFSVQERIGASLSVVAWMRFTFSRQSNGPPCCLFCFSRFQ